MSNVINNPLSMWKKVVIQCKMGIEISQVFEIGCGTVDRFVRQFLYEAMSRTFTLWVRSDKRGAHNLLKPEYYI